MKSAAVSPTVRVDFEKDGAHFDDIAISGDAIAFLHIEMMDDGYCWGRIVLKDGRAVVLGFAAEKRGKLAATAEWE